MTSTTTWHVFLTIVQVLADVDISPNSNPFNVWIAKYEYIKKLEYEYIFYKVNESIYGLESEYISFFFLPWNTNTITQWEIWTSAQGLAAFLTVIFGAQLAKCSKRQLPLKNLGRL